MAYFFIQLSDPQFGMFASFSGLDDAAIEDFRRKGLHVRPAPRTTGFAEETALYEAAIAAVNDEAGTGRGRRMVHSEGGDNLMDRQSRVGGRGAGYKTPV